MHEARDLLGDIGAVRGDCEVSAIDEFHFSIRNVALERFGARGNEKHIVLTPDSQQRRFALAEVSLPGRIERNVVPIVMEKIELDLVDSGPLQISEIEHVAIG